MCRQPVSLVSFWTLRRIFNGRFVSEEASPAFAWEPLSRVACWATRPSNIPGLTGNGAVHPFFPWARRKDSLGSGRRLVAANKRHAPRFHRVEKILERDSISIFAWSFLGRNDCGHSLREMLPHKRDWRGVVAAVMPNFYESCARSQCECIRAISMVSVFSALRDCARASSVLCRHTCTAFW
jgi:hypothetical protein